MAEEPEQLRHDIEGTRSQLSSDLDALSDRLAPSNIAQRQVDKAKASVTGVKDRVFGSAHDAADSVRDAAGDARGGAADGKAAVRRKAQGNPLAAGLIAFGAGWLISSLLPASDKETEAAGSLVEKVKDSPLLKEAKATTSDIGSSLGEHAKDAAASVKETAQGAAATVQDDARDAAGTVKDHGTQAAQDVKDTAGR
ncbi:DUF3618 domain-containing protein [Kineococcus rhizosphaerae]|uniref:Uncharacterized protein DUF3618 n=1 Tax=Kineococcus rhizosphaerae TaxID=559628 RepID=A0A2T0QXG5_9ACTN|nr:DUF3618 domain-containing protein [Kineococcus rhizosphaerae]PRY10550.1 uncharacterized protein DUF3618 [Kineococcus rhizosphaerae]